jgi:hypothetical protein
VNELDDDRACDLITEKLVKLGGESMAHRIKKKSEFERWDGRFFYYALVLRGGLIPGQRPRTRVAIITDCTFDDQGKIVAARGFISSKNKLRIEPDTIITTWTEKPRASVIRRARQTLPVSPGL